MRVLIGEKLQTYTVNQLWPKENKNVDPTPQLLTIILFYGLQMESGTRPEETTFTERGTERCYFVTWLIDDLLARGIKNVRVLSLSYDALARVWGRGGRTRDVSDIGKDLVQKLISKYSDPTLHTYFCSLAVSLLLQYCCGFTLVYTSVKRALSEFSSTWNLHLQDWHLFAPDREDRWHVSRWFVKER